MSINVKTGKIHVGAATVFGGRKVRAGPGGNTRPAPQILKKNRFPKIRGMNGKK